MDSLMLHCWGGSWRWWRFQNSCAPQWRSRFYVNSTMSSLYLGKRQAPSKDIAWCSLGTQTNKNNKKNIINTTHRDKCSCLTFCVAVLRDGGVLFFLFYHIFYLRRSVHCAAGWFISIFLLYRWKHFRSISGIISTFTNNSVSSADLAAGKKTFKQLEGGSHLSPSAKIE